MVNQAFYAAEPGDPDGVAGWVGYTHREPVTRDGFTLGDRLVEDLFPVHAGATCDWTPVLAAGFAEAA